MSSYRPSVDSARPVVTKAAPEAPVPVGPLVSMVAFRAADLRVRPGIGSGRRDVTLLASPGTAGVATGTLVTFWHPVVSVPAVVRRDGTVLAGGWLPDFVRLGELERPFHSGRRRH